MKVTIDMSADDLKMLRSFLVVSLNKGEISQDVRDIVCSASNQLDQQLYGMKESTLAQYITDYILEEKARGNVDLDCFLVQEAIDAYEGAAR